MGRRARVKVVTPQEAAARQLQRPKMNLNRRKLLLGGMAGIAASGQLDACTLTDSSRVEGMLIGSLIGDALGGPIEFLAPDRVRKVMPGARRWNEDRTIDADILDELAKTLSMEPYETLRPGTAPYGPWMRRAPRGTITDDSRHKIVLMRALRAALAEGRTELATTDLANAFLSFQPHIDRQPNAALKLLVDEGLREYRYAANWLLGQRDPKVALPVERLWSGISNCSGQMAMLPLAAAYPDQPDQAYRATYTADFIDAPTARDIVSAINAGLAAVLADEREVSKRWDRLLTMIRETDPFRMRDVPFAGRPLDRWLDLADSIAERANGRPAKAYELLESEGKPVYWWDAHLTLLVPLTLLKLCRFNPLAAMHLTLDFGHDTDSYAQVLGAMAGAVHGKDIFPESMISAVEDRLAADYGESIGDWTQTLTQASETFRSTR